MKNKSAHAIVAGALAVSLLSACTPSDSGAEGLAAELSSALGELSLDEVALVNPEAANSFSSMVDPLRDFPLDVTPGEITYEMNDAVLPLTWDWDIGGNHWQYTTEVDLTYSESQWWVTWVPGSFIPGLEPGQRVGVDSVSPDRAGIISGDGTPIISERTILLHGLDKTKVDPKELDQAAHDIATATSVDPDDFVSRVNAAGPKAFVEALAVRPEDLDAWVQEDFATLPGALVVSSETLLGPTRTFARELLGRAGAATAEIIEESDGAIAEGDLVGISGLQLQYDERLRGADSVVVFSVDSSACKDPLECDPNERNILAELEEREPEELHLSLDIDTQVTAEEVLRGAYEDPEHAAGSALVAIRPSTGEILALANGEGNRGLNHALVGQYPPGSTFKVVTALALLRSGLSPDDSVSCPQTTVVDGREFKNYDGYPASKTGDITFQEAFAASCNTALIELRDRITSEDLLAAAHSLGFGTDLDGADLGFPAFLGELPISEGGTAFAAALIGQGTTLTSPLSMAVVAASVQEGTTVTPRLIEGISSDSDPAEPLTNSEADSLRRLMESVVNTGTGSVLAGIPGEPVLAKTGTAEYGEGEADPHAWIIAAHGDLAVAVFVEEGLGGGETAGPLAREFLTAMGGE